MHYKVTTAKGISALKKVLTDLRKDGHRLVSVTERHGKYTIIYEGEDNVQNKL